MQRSVQGGGKRRRETPQVAWVSGVIAASRTAAACYPVATRPDLRVAPNARNLDEKCIIGVFQAVISMWRGDGAVFAGGAPGAVRCCGIRDRLCAVPCRTPAAR